MPRFFVFGQGSTIPVRFYHGLCSLDEESTSTSSSLQFNRDFICVDTNKLSKAYNFSSKIPDPCSIGLRRCIICWIKYKNYLSLNFN